MSGMKAYYLSRAVLSTAFGLLFALTGSAWWVALLVGLVLFGLFLWAPRSGRYAVHPEYGVTALRRDERTQGINDKAARNAFVVVGIALGALLLYTGLTAAAVVPTSAIDWLLLLGVAVYYASDLALRRR
jgi:hypothetical protein